MADNGQIDSLEILVETESKKAISQLDDLKNALKDVRTVLTSASKQDIDFGTGKVKKAKVAYQDFMKSIKDIGKINVDTNNIKDVEIEIGKLENRLKTLNARKDKKETFGINKDSQEFKSLSYDIVRATNELDSYKKKLLELQAIQSANRPKNFWEDSGKMKLLNEKGFTDEPIPIKFEEPDPNDYNFDFPDIEPKVDDSGIVSMTQSLNDLSGEFKGTISDTQDFEVNVSSLKSELKSLSDQGLSFGDNDFDDAYEQMQEMLLAQKEQKKYLEELAKISNQALSGEGKAASMTAKEMQDLAREKAKVSTNNKELNKSAQESQKGLQAEGNSAKQAKEQLAKFSKFANAGKQLFGKMDSSIGKFGNKVGNAFKPVQREIGNALKSLLGFKKEAGKKTSIGHMIGMSVLYSSVFQLISSIKTAIAEGSKNLVQYSGEYNKSISSIISALLMLKNAFAVAFAPIVNVVAPYLSVFIEMISKALNAVGQFFAALTGKKYAVQAKKVYQDYGKVLEDQSTRATKGTKKANKAVKELKRTIMGFDELNVLNDNTKDPTTYTETPGTSKYTGVSPADMFTTVPIDKEISAFAKKMRDAIKREDWEGLGKIIADGFNKGMQKVYDAINWNNVGPKITYFCNAFTRTFNSLVDNIDWDLMGRTVGAGINTIINTLNLLIEGINWKNLGAKFATGVNGIFTEVNFENIGNFLGNKFMIIWNILDGFFNGNGEKDPGLNYALMGKKFGDGINGIFEKVNFTTIGRVLSGGLNGLRDILNNFNDTVHWNDIAKNLYNGINYFIHNTDWAGLGKSLSDLTMNLLGTINEVVQNTDWKQIGRDIGEFLGSIDWKGIASTLLDIIWTAFSGVISGLFDTKDGKVILALGSGLLAIKALFKGFTIASEVAKFMGPLMDMSPAIAEAVAKVSSSLDSIGSVVFSPTGALIAGVAIGVGLIITHWDEIKDAAKKVYESVSGWWDETKKNSKATWDSVCDQMSGAWGNLKKWGSETFENIHDSASNWWGETKKDTKSTWDSVSQQVNDTWSGLKTKANEKFGGVADTVKKAWNKTENDTRGDWGVIGQILSGDWAGMKRDAGTAVSNIAKEFTSLPGKISDKLGGLWKIGRNAIKNFADGFSNFHIPLPHINMSSTQHSIGGIEFSTPKFGIDWYKKGGFPTGEIWGMNEFGNPEMVGKVGNKNAVANNAVIADAIKNAVVDGMDKVFSNAHSDNNNNQAPVVNIQIGNKQITDFIIEEVTKRVKSSGKLPFPFNFEF